LGVSEGIVPGAGDLGRGPVVQSKVRSVVVTIDVGADHLPCLLEGLELVQPDAALLQLREPGFDERLTLGVAVATEVISSRKKARRKSANYGCPMGGLASTLGVFNNRRR
jgi:hypothetical protein